MDGGHWGTVSSVPWPDSVERGAHGQSLLPSIGFGTAG